MDYLYNFLDANLGIQTSVEDYFYLGNLSPKPIVIEFQSANDKRAALKYKALLKDFRSVTNEGKESKVYINDYMPLATQERRRRERRVIQQAKEDNPNVNVEYTRAGLTLQGAPYRKKILPPTAKDQVELSVKDLDEVLKIPVNRSEKQVKDGNIFVGYTAPVKTRMCAKFTNS